MKPLTDEQKKIATKLKRIRKTLDRRRKSLAETERRQREDIRMALAAGARPVDVAKAAGLTVSRIAQIRNSEG